VVSTNTREKKLVWNGREERAANGKARHAVVAVHTSPTVSSSSSASAMSVLAFALPLAVTVAIALPVAVALAATLAVVVFVSVATTRLVAAALLPGAAVVAFPGALPSGSVKGERVGTGNESEENGFVLYSGSTS